MCVVEIEDVVRDNYSALRSRALQLTRDSQRAGDLVQSTFERYLRSKPMFLSDGELRRWLLVVMRNLFLDTVRSNDSRWMTLPDVPDSDRTPLDEPVERPAWEWLNKDDVCLAVRLLPESMRRPYEMHALSNLTYREIAQRLGLPIVTVGTRIHRAKRLLRVSLTRTLEMKTSTPDSLRLGRVSRTLP
jgi:RNA polymerase sigma-70 factor, ECF subfamily